MTMATQERERREWWANFEGNVIRVTGYSCGPEYPDSWWCQQVGHTLTEGYHLFASEAEALLVAIREANQAIQEATGKRDCLQGRLVAVRDEA